MLGYLGMLRYLKSELEIETIDESGNKINTMPPATPVPPADADSPPVPGKMDEQPAPLRPRRSTNEPQKVARPAQMEVKI